MHPVIKPYRSYKTRCKCGTRILVTNAERIGQCLHCKEEKAIIYIQKRWKQKLVQKRMYKKMALLISLRYIGPIESGLPSKVSSFL